MVKVFFFFWYNDISPQYLVWSSIFRTHFGRDVGKESHLLASRDTGTLDVEHRRAGGEKVVVVVVEGEDRTRRDTGKRSECAVVSPEGLLGDFWTAVLNQVSFPRRVSGTSNPLSRCPSLFLSLSLFLSQFRRTCLRYTEQSKRAIRSTTLFFSYAWRFSSTLPNSVERWKMRGRWKIIWVEKILKRAMRYAFDDSHQTVSLSRLNFF